MNELVELILEIEENLELIMKLQLFDSRVEFHFDKLDELAVTLLFTFLSSKPFNHLGDWAFKLSSMPTNVKETMNL